MLLQPSSTRSWLKPHPPINELAIVTALSRQPLAQSGINASPSEMGAVQGKRTVFSTRLCIGGQQWPTQSQPRHFQSRAQRQPLLSAPFGCTDPPPPVPQLRLLQLLLPSCIHFSCCSPIASSSTAAPRVHPHAHAVQKVLQIRRLRITAVVLPPKLPSSVTHRQTRI